MTDRAQLSELLARLGDQQRECLRDVAEEFVREPSGVRAELMVTVRALDDRQVAQLLGVARSMTLPIEETISTEGELITPSLSTSGESSRLSFARAFRPITPRTRRRWTG